MCNYMYIYERAGILIIRLGVYSVQMIKPHVTLCALRQLVMLHDVDEHYYVTHCIFVIRCLWEDHDTTGQISTYQTQSYQSVEYQLYFFLMTSFSSCLMYKCTFWRHSELFDVMAYFLRRGVFLTSWRIVDSWRTFWRHDVLLISWRIFWRDGTCICYSMMHLLT